MPVCAIHSLILFPENGPAPLAVNNITERQFRPKPTIAQEPKRESLRPTGVYCPFTVGTGKAGYTFSIGKTGHTMFSTGKTGHTIFSTGKTNARIPWAPACFSSSSTPLMS